MGDFNLVTACVASSSSSSTFHEYTILQPILCDCAIYSNLFALNFNGVDREYREFRVTHWQSHPYVRNRTNEYTNQTSERRKESRGKKGIDIFHLWLHLIWMFRKVGHVSFGIIFFIFYVVWFLCCSTDWFYLIYMKNSIKWVFLSTRDQAIL